MKLTDLDFPFPAELIATTPERPSRVLWVDQQGPREISLQQLLEQIPSGDILVINDTRVLKRRVYSEEGLEILFLNPRSEDNRQEWEVLFPSRKVKMDQDLQLPRHVKMRLIQKGRPQWVRVSEPLTESYFEQVAELPLPPYIQQARGARHAVSQDQNWYQTAWSQVPGSLAAPTASLHFSADDLQNLRQRGVEVLTLTLHVGLGTFLPITVNDISQHQMHAEFVSMARSTWERIAQQRQCGKKVWALGTTATRALESAAQNHLTLKNDRLEGWTDIFIQPGFEFQIIDRLMTNFHQPQSTLLALVGAFAGLDQVKACYSYAIERKFRLFSYGDLSVWIR